MGKIRGYNRTQFGTGLNTGDIQRAGATNLSAGQVGQIATGAALQITQQKLQIDTQAFMAKESLDFEAKLNESFTSWKKENEGNNDADFNSFRQSEIARLRDESIQRAPNGIARRAFSQRAYAAEKNMEMQAQNWKLQRLAINTGEVVQDGLETLQTQAYRDANPAALGDILARSEEQLTPLQNTHKPEQIAEAREKFQFNTTINSFEGMIHGGEISEAKRLLNSRQFDEYLGANGIKRLEKQIAIYERQNKKKDQNFERLKFSDPYRYLDKKDEGLAKLGEDGFFSFNDSDAVAKRLSFIEEAQANNPGMKLPFFAKDEIAAFKDQFERSGNKDRLNFLEKIEMLPVDKIDFYDQIGAPREIGFFKNFSNENDRELFIQATLAKDIKPTEDARSRDITESIESSETFTALMDAAESMPGNSAFRETVQNLSTTMKRVSILKNDPDGGAEFFKKNFQVINNDDGFVFDNNNKTHAIIPRGVDIESIEEMTEKNREKLIENRVKGMSSQDAYFIRSNIEKNGIWVNSENGLVLVDRNTGKAYPGSMARISFNGNGDPKNVAQR